MLFEFNRFSSLLLIFFVHGLVYSVLLYRKGLVNETRSDKWLSLFLFLCILYIAPWMVGFGGWYDNQPYRDILFYTPFQHLYFIGPVMFFYVQSLLNPSFHFGKKEWLHFIPGLLYIIYSIVVVVTDKLVLRQYYFLADGTDRDFDTWYQVSGFVSMIIYFFLSLRYYSLYKKLIVQVVSYAEVVMFRWVRNFLLAFLLMLLVRFAFYIANFFIEEDYWVSWWHFMLFAIIFYYIAITGYANSVETKISFRPNMLRYRPQLLLNYLPAINDNNNFIEDAEVIDIEQTNAATLPNDPLVKEWKERLLALLKEGAYEDAELSLTSVARQLKSNPSFISKMINQGFALNFNELVNQFRIEAIKAKLDKGEHKQKTLLGIGFECGFNSKATFNRAFKKATGQSPRDYIRKMK